MRKAIHIIPFVGKEKGSNCISRVPGLLCIRKGVEKDLVKSYLKTYGCSRKDTDFVAFVSSPYIYQNGLAREIVKVWFHPFRNPKKYLPKKVPSYFMSESDFVDPSMLREVGDDSLDRSDKSWDYFYFTVGGDDGVNHKGYERFRAILPTIAHLKGCVIIYGKTKKFEKHEVQCLRDKYGLKVMLSLLTYKDVQNWMRKCKFGLFPNIQDCSPRMIPEAMLQNVPVLVNNDILGGWKYVNSETGRFFSLSTIKKDVQYMIENKFSPKKNFLKEYGFVNSARRLAEFLSPHYKSVRNYEMIYFQTYKDVMRRLIS